MVVAATPLSAETTRRRPRGSSRAPRACAVPVCSSVKLGGHAICAQQLLWSTAFHTCLGAAHAALARRCVGRNRFADPRSLRGTAHPRSANSAAYRRPDLGGRPVFGHGEVQVAVGRFAACRAAGRGEFAQLRRNPTRTCVVPATWPLCRDGPRRRGFPDSRRRRSASISVQDVRRLGCAVCDELVVVAAAPSWDRRNRRHPCTWPPDERMTTRAPPAAASCGSEEPGELEVPEMVRPHLEFEAIVGAAERGEHDAGVVHQDMNRRRDVADRRGGGANAGQRGEIEMHGRGLGARAPRPGSTGPSAARASMLRAARTTCAPAAASARADSRPSPDDAP